MVTLVKTKEGLREVKKKCGDKLMLDDELPTEWLQHGLFDSAPSQGPKRHYAGYMNGSLCEANCDNNVLYVNRFCVEKSQRSLSDIVFDRIDKIFRDNYNIVVVVYRSVSYKDERCFVFFHRKAR